MDNARTMAPPALHEILMAVLWRYRIEELRESFQA